MPKLDGLKTKRNFLFVNHLLAMGDAVFLSPVFKTLKDNLPGASISVLTRRYAVDFLEAIPYVDAVVDLEEMLSLQRDIVSLREKIAVMYRLTHCFRKHKYDCIILRNDVRVPHTRKLYLAAKLSGAKIVSLTSFLNKHVKNGQHIVEIYYDILEDIGFHLKEKGKLYLNLSSDSVNFAENYLRENGLDTAAHNVVGVVPSAGLRIKNWRPDKVAALCDGLGDFAKAIIFSTDPQAREEISRCTTTNPIFVGLMQFPDLLGLISLCDVFVGVDTGPIHLAATLGIPTIGLYGPTSGVLTGPFGSRCQSIQAEPKCPDYKPLAPFSPSEPLQPCYINNTCTRFDTSCVDLIEPRVVTEKVLNILRDNATEHQEGSKINGF